jgi:Co/Zn/Cd efflux system component
MAVLHHHHHPAMSAGEQKRCVLMFCLTWVAFFALIGAAGWIISSL